MHFLRKKFVQPVRSVLVRTCTENSSKLKRAIVYISNFRTPYRPYGLFEVRTDFLYTPRRSVIYESPIRHFKVQKVQGACHQPHRSPSSPLHFTTYLYISNEKIWCTTTSAGVREVLRDVLAVLCVGNHTV